LTPEVVHPWLVVVHGRTVQPAARALRFVPLEELAQVADTILDGHLRVVALRALSLFAGTP
jgi:hypothetical protein